MLDSHLFIYEIKVFDSNNSRLKLGAFRLSDPHKLSRKSKEEHIVFYVLHPQTQRRKKKPRRARPGFSSYVRLLVLPYCKYLVESHAVTVAETERCMRGRHFGQISKRFCEEDLAVVPLCSISVRLYLTGLTLKIANGLFKIKR